jgi:site-specific recombinase XerD
MEELVERHADTAAIRQPSMRDKNVTPLVLRHSCAMALRRGGVDRVVLAIWLGHEQVEATDIYVHADLSIKEQALARTKPPHVRLGRYRPPDRLLAFLQGL